MTVSHYVINSKKYQSLSFVGNWIGQGLPNGSMFFKQSIIFFYPSFDFESLLKSKT